MTGPVIWCSHWYTMGSEELPASLLSSFSRAHLNCWYLHSCNPCQIMLARTVPQYDRSIVQPQHPHMLVRHRAWELTSNFSAQHWRSCMR